MSTGGDAVEFEVALPPAVLRRNVHTVARRNPKPGQSARRAVHWSDRSKAAEEYAEAVWIASRMSVGEYSYCDMDNWYHGRVQGLDHRELRLPWEKASVQYEWHSTHQVDEDNIISSLKVLLDCLTTKGRRPLGLILDDKGVSVSATWKKCATKKEERVVVKVTKA